MESVIKFWLPFPYLDLFDLLHVVFHLEPVVVLAHEGAHQQGAQGIHMGVEDPKG